jgi:hypothetical protein
MNDLYTYGQDVTSEHPEVKITIEVITPDVAQRMLKSNVHNRNMKRVGYVQDMLDGAWSLNGSTIVFSNTGLLLDGQNRLMACVRANKPFTTIVVRGIAFAAQESMDIGPSRTLSDMLALRGYPNSSTLAAIAGTLARVDRHGEIEYGFYRVHSDTFTRRELLTYVEENYDKYHMANIVNYARRVSTKKEPTSMWGVLIREFLKSGEDNTTEFISQVNESKKPSDQVFMLLKKLKANRESTKSEQQKIIAAWIIKTWNAWMKGVPVTPNTLRLTLGGAHPENFPTVYVAE